MRTFDLHEFLPLPRLTTGRRQMALERIRAVAVSRGLASLVTTIDEALLVESHALELALRWSKAAEDHALHADDARKLDARLDKAVSALHDSLELMVRALEEDQSSPARTLLEVFFPKGPGAITNLPYVDQHAHVTKMLERLDEPVHRDAIIALGQQVWVTRIREVNERYGRALARPERLTRDQVTAADRDGWMAMLTVVAQILGTYPQHTEADRIARRALLLPLTDQQDQMSALRARRRGESAPEAEEPTPAEPLPEGPALEPTAAS